MSHIKVIIGLNMLASLTMTASEWTPADAQYTAIAQRALTDMEVPDIPTVRIYQGSATTTRKSTVDTVQRLMYMTAGAESDLLYQAYWHAAHLRNNSSQFSSAKFQTKALNIVVWSSVAVAAFTKFHMAVCDKQCQQGLLGWPISAAGLTLSCASATWLIGRASQVAEENATQESRARAAELLASTLLRKNKLHELSSMLGNGRRSLLFRHARDAQENYYALRSALIHNGATITTQDAQMLRLQHGTNAVNQLIRVDANNTSTTLFTIQNH